MTVSVHKYRFPIETEEAKKFWASRHICNRVKAIIAFSLDMNDAMLNLRRHLPKDFSHNNFHFRKRAVNAWQHYVNMPDMEKVPFTPLGVDWWDCIPKDPEPPVNGRWVKWNDAEQWLDPEKWIEWVEDPTP